MGCARSIHVSEGRTADRGGKEAEDATGPAGPRRRHSPGPAASPAAGRPGLAASEPRGGRSNRVRGAAGGGAGGRELALRAAASGAPDGRPQPGPRFVAPPDARSLRAPGDLAALAALPSPRRAGREPAGRSVCADSALSVRAAAAGCPVTPRAGRLPLGAGTGNASAPRAARQVRGPRAHVRPEPPLSTGPRAARRCCAVFTRRARGRLFYFFLIACFRVCCQFLGLNLLFYFLFACVFCFVCVFISREFFVFSSSFF